MKMIPRLRFSSKDCFARRNLSTQTVFHLLSGILVVLFPLLSASSAAVQAQQESISSLGIKLKLSFLIANDLKKFRRIIKESFEEDLLDHMEFHLIYKKIKGCAVSPKQRFAVASLLTKIFFRGTKDSEKIRKFKKILSLYNEDKIVQEIEMQTSPSEPRRKFFYDTFRSEFLQHVSSNAKILKRLIINTSEFLTLEDVSVIGESHDIEKKANEFLSRVECEGIKGLLRMASAFLMVDPQGF